MKFKWYKIDFNVISELHTKANIIWKKNQYRTLKVQGQSPLL